MNQKVRNALFFFRRNDAQASYLRLVEIIGIAFLAVFTFGLYAFYQNVAAPAYARIQGLDKQCQDLKVKAEKLREERSQAERDQKALGDAVTNMKRFEEQFLLEPRTGQLALIDEINALARKTNVRIPEGIAFDANRGGAADQTASDAERQPAATRKDEKEKLSRYPTFNVEFGIVGSYQQLRQFIRGLEQSRQFVILNLLTVEPNTEAGGGGQGAALGGVPIGANPAAASNPNDISVGLTLTAYFRG